MSKVFVTLICALFGIFGCTTITPPVTSDETDNTNELQALFDASGPEIVIPAKETPWITRPLKITAQDKKIIFSEGCRIQAKKGSFQDPGDCLITISDSRNLVLEGHSAVLAMQKKDYTGAGYKKGEWRHGIAIQKSSNISILGLTIRDTGGDGIYIGQRSLETVCENITLKNLVLDNNHRQGISVTAVKNLLLENCQLKGTNGTPPMAGIDFEPNSNLYGLTGCVIRNCVFEKNSGPGILVYLKKLSKNQPPVDIQIENAVSKKNIFSVAVYSIPKGVTGRVAFKNCDLSLMKWICVPKGFTVSFEKD